MVELYKDGNVMSTVTDAADEYSFTEEFSQAISQLIEANKFEHDWEYQLRAWLPQYADIIGKLRGYKTDVRTKTVIIAGNSTADPSDIVVVIDNDKREVVVSDETKIRL